MTVKTSMTTIALLIAILVFANAQGSITGTGKLRTWLCSRERSTRQSDGAKLTGTVKQGASDPATGHGHLADCSY